jgi:hypothetical protein
VKPNFELYVNASLLELGQSNFDRIKVDLITAKPPIGPREGRQLRNSNDE